MTEGRMALVELLQKSGDRDFLRAVAEAVLQILMEADVEGLIGGGRGGHTGAPPRLRMRHRHQNRLAGSTRDLLNTLTEKKAASDHLATHGLTPPRRTAA
jgi:hypothetical protein